MIRVALAWLGLAEPHPPARRHHHHAPPSEAHGHAHGVIDPSVVTTERGIWAIKWSFVILAITSAAQLAIVALSGSVALLADTIHNIGDAGTAIPLWIAFVLARRPPSSRFTYGYGRVEDLAGVAIVGVILFSAIVAGWQAIERLLDPQPIAFLGCVAAAGVIGFLGNEAVAEFRIGVGRAIESAALVADGYHARVDGLTSLAVVLGALGVWLGFPLADPIVGLAITAMIFGIVWQSAKAVFTRLLDGVEPRLTAELHSAARHVPGIVAIDGARARWLGHRLYAEAEMILDPELSVRDATVIAEKLRAEAHHHLPALSQLRLEIKGRPTDARVLVQNRAFTPESRSASSMRVLRRAIKSVRRNTLRGTVQTALAVIEDQAFDLRYGVDTRGTIHLKDLTINSRHVEHGVDYAPTRVRYFRAILRALPIQPDSVFVDFGAGKGRILLLAARSGCFRKVVGVEFSVDLCRAAERNIRRFQRRRARNVRFEVVHGDAADYHVQPDQNVFFMFNPFDHIVMRQVIKHVAHSLEERPRPIWLIYLNVKDDSRRLIVQNGYKEANQVSYGNAMVSIFVNDGANRAWTESCQAPAGRRGRGYC
jgi:cation diffusion facilitator family transporter